MTTKKKRRHIEDICHSYRACSDGCPINDKYGVGNCPLAKDNSDDTYERIYDELNPAIPHIRDSGARREFETGAVRDIQEGKGRCDLMPLGVIARLLNDNTLIKIYSFQKSGGVDYLYDLLKYTKVIGSGLPALFLEVSKHFEEGAKKYGEHNWQKGIPTHCYIDSAVRHYLKWLRGDNDEPHDRAFVWNILCCIWTCENKPELNDYKTEDKK